MAAWILRVFIFIHFMMHWPTEAQELIGCFTFNYDNTVLSVKAHDKIVSIDGCIHQCRTHRATYAGVRIGNQCYCGDSHNHTVNGKQLSDSSCTTTCNDHTNRCGSQFSIVIYSLCNIDRYRDNSNAEPNCDASCNCNDSSICLYNSGLCPANCEVGWSGDACNWRAEERVGCFSFNHGNTVLSVQTQVAVASIGTCIQQCKTLRFTYAGVRIGFQCYCGDNHDHTVNGGQLRDSSCTTSCNDHMRLCGGQDSIVIYSVCSRGRYRDNSNDGPNCDASCNCENNHVCLYNNGSCPDNCEIGWSGEACNWRGNQPTTIQSADEYDGVSDMVTQYATNEVSGHTTVNPTFTVTTCVGCPDLLATLGVTSVGLVISIIINIYLANRLRVARIPDKQLPANIRAIHNSSDRNSNDTQYENMVCVQTEPSNYEQLGSRQTEPAIYEELGMAGPTLG